MLKYYKQAQTPSLHLSHYPSCEHSCQGASKNWERIKALCEFQNLILNSYNIIQSIKILVQKSHVTELYAKRQKIKVCGNSLLNMYNNSFFLLKFSEGQFETNTFGLQRVVNI